MILIPHPNHGEIIDMTDTMYPTKMISISDDFDLEPMVGNIYGFVTSGSFQINTGNADRQWTIKEGDFFSLKTNQDEMTEAFQLQDDSQMFWIVRYGFQGINIMGESENRGRLSYIDGCTDSLLIMPPRLGDPCLNYLHFPMGIEQTQHLHPSIRMGIVIGGKGEAFQKPDGKMRGWEEDLSKGMMFCLEEGEIHSFRTAENFMDIIAYHPDSDFGPTDTDHPMLNRTYINHGKG